MRSFLKEPIPTLFTRVLTTALLFFSCTHDPQLVDELAPVCYTTEVLPVLQSSCGTVGCHAQAGHETSFSVQSYSSIMSIVEPGNAKKSKLYEVITSIYGENAMPPDQPLTKEQRSVIMVWIEQGASETCADPNTPSPNPTTPVGEQPSDTLCFTQVIQPLLVSSCATTGCHDAASAREGVVLTNYNSILNYNELVRPYQPNESKLYKVLFESGEDRMPPPPNEPLSSEQKEYIWKWIAEGALNSNCPNTGCDTLNAISFSSQIKPVIDLSCVGCHNSNTTNAGINLEGYSQIASVAGTTFNGESLLVGVVRKLQGFSPMPPSGSLSECDIRKIELWIEQGMQNN